MKEDRKSPRYQPFKAAHIAFEENNTAINCVVRDLSERGACLAILAPANIPEKFNLVFEQGGAVRPCRVIWRENTRIGIEFLAK